MSGPDGTADPVRAERATWAKWGSRGRTAGYLAWAVAVVAVVVGLATELSDGVVVVATGFLVLGCLLLLPGIIVGYAVRAADRADRDQTW